MFGFELSFVTRLVVFLLVYIYYCIHAHPLQEHLFQLGNTGFVLTGARMSLSTQSRRHVYIHAFAILFGIIASHF
jgi:hypothetical protein